MPTEQQITVTFPDKSTASKIVDMIVRKRPIGWSRKSYATYFDEDNAKWLASQLESMIVDRQPRVFRYSMWPNTSPNSVYLRINRAFMYLLEYLDPDGKYQKLRHDTKIERIKTVGVTITYRDHEPLENLKSEVFVPKSETKQWKKKIDMYIDDDSAIKPLHIDNLLLSNDEVELVKSELDGLENIQYSISNREIKIIKSL